MSDLRQGGGASLRFAAVLFDLDGTLVETRRDIAAAVNRVLAERGLSPLDVTTVSRHVGRGSRILMAGCLRESTGNDPAPETVENAYQRFHDHYMEHLFDTTYIYDGVAPMLGRLQDLGVRMGIVSNKPVAPTQAILKGLGLARYFGVILGGESLPERKPSPVPLLHACGSLDVASSRTAMVGDSFLDVEAARAAGMASAVVTWGFTGREELTASGPDFLAESAADLERWLTGPAPHGSASSGAGS